MGIGLDGNPTQGDARMATTAKLMTMLERSKVGFELEGTLKEDSERNCVEIPYSGGWLTITDQISGWVLRRDCAGNFVGEISGLTDSQVVDIVNIMISGDAR